MTLSTRHPDIEADLELMRDAAEQAGRIAMSYFGARNEVWHKKGNSPVSEADYAVDAHLKSTLMAARPDYGWLSEETDDTAERLGRDRLFVVDPIDGTRGFLDGRKEWCVSVGLVENHQPVAGVLVCPALDRHFHALSGQGAYVNDTRLEPLAGDGIRSVTGSRKLNEALLASGRDLDVAEFIPSLAYRIAMVANGELDGALARPGAHDWDLAAAHALLNEAGGMLTDLHGAPRRYNTPDTRSGSLLASGKRAHPALMELANSGGFLH